MLGRRTTRTSQPAQVVGRTVTAQGFTPEFCFVGSAPGVDWATGLPWTVASGFTDGYAANVRARSFTSADGQTRAGLKTAWRQCTALAVFTRTSSSSYAVLGSSALAASNTGYRLGLSSGGTAVGLTKGGVVDLGNVSFTSNVVNVVVASHNESTGEYYCVVQPLNGGSRTRITATNTSASGNGTGSAVIHRQGGANALVGQIALVAMAGQFIPEAAALKLLQNPWQILQGVDRRVVFPAEASAPSSFIAAWARRPARTIGAGVI